MIEPGRLELGATTTTGMASGRSPAIGGARPKRSAASETSGCAWSCNLSPRGSLRYRPQPSGPTWSSCGQFGCEHQSSFDDARRRPSSLSSSSCHQAQVRRIKTRRRRCKWLEAVSVAAILSWTLAGAPLGAAQQQGGDQLGRVPMLKRGENKSIDESQQIDLAGRQQANASDKMKRTASSIFDSLLGSLGSSSPAPDDNNSNNNNHHHHQRNNNPHNTQTDSNPYFKIGQVPDKVTLPGDILLGGLFPIHMKGTKIECGQINRDRGIQRLEAMLYALDRINEDSLLLPDIKLGAILLDSCSSSTYALNQSLEFIRASINTVESSAFECKDKSTPRPKYGSKMIAGVIGGSYSEVSLQVANLLRLFRIPQVSYASTGTALSDKTLYDLFARTVPSDMFQARAIADIVHSLNWTYVSLVSSEGLYGDSGSKEFMKQASNRRICIAVHEKISPTIGDGAYDLIVQSLFKRNATGVVLFTRAEDTRELLMAVKRAKLLHNFAWVAADGWGTHQKLVEGVEEVAWGAITVELQAKAIPGFDQYMKALTPWGNRRNPWFSEYWQEWFDCQLQANLLLQQQRLAGGAQLFSRRSLDGLAEQQRELRQRASRSTQPGGSGNNTTGFEQDETNQVNASSWPPAKPAQQRLDGPRVKRMATSSSTAALNLAEPDEAMRVKQFCSPNLRISESNGYRQEQKVQFVVDAVYAMAHALHKAWYHLCDAKPGVVCEALKELNGGEFYTKYLLNVSFKDLAGSEVKFDEHGDGLGRYNIYNFRQVRSQAATPALTKDLPVMDTNTPNDSIAELEFLGGGSPDAAPIDKFSGVSSGNNYQKEADAINGPDSFLVEQIYTSNVEFEYSTVGRWTENDFNLPTDEIQFFQGDSELPESFCSKPCQAGEAKMMRAGDHCCWICKPCQPYEFLPDEFSCQDCGLGRWPHANKTSCFDLPQKYLRWDSLISLISLTIACFGIGLTLFVTIIFVKYIDTPVVKASGRELSFILLAGVAVCHLSTFVLLAKPTFIVCAGQRFLVNFGFALMYSSLLVKTNRISRIFNCARKSAKRPSFISPKSQMLITGILVGIQIFLTIVWYFFEPPGVRADSPEGKRDEVILKCRVQGRSFILSLVYNMILITTCTVYAVKTRKIPENFNESKFIGFTMYTTIVIWLAFVTMFFGTNNSHEIQINTMCVCISLSAYVTLFCLFSPKISIILFHPDKNVRKLTMNSATYKRAFKPVSSVASMDGRHNLPPGGPNSQPEAASGGPMSTTSNVLNLDTQGNRFQESSTVSNVVNSNSAGSNCSQKTPTILSQQLALAGICANCGAHQLTSAPTAANSSTNGGGVGFAQVGSSMRHANGGISKMSTRLKLADDGACNQQANQCQITRHAGRSNCGGGHVASSEAKVLHEKITKSGGGQTRPATAMQSAANDATSSTLRNRKGGGGLKRSPSDELLLAKRSSMATGQHGQLQDHLTDMRNTNQLYHCQSNQMQQRLATSAGTATSDSYVRRKSSQTNETRYRHIGSLSRLNEMTSFTSSGERQYIEESISSLANDSFMNNSLENTPCNAASRRPHHEIDPSHHQHQQVSSPLAAQGNNNGNGNEAEADQCKGSDSMLCNQSLHSLDYCSDCCPSLCQYSCQACLAQGGYENGASSVCAHRHNSLGLLQTDDNDDYDDDELEIANEGDDGDDENENNTNENGDDDDDFGSHGTDYDAMCFVQLVNRDDNHAGQGHLDDDGSALIDGHAKAITPLGTSYLDTSGGTSTSAFTMVKCRKLSSESGAVGVPGAAFSRQLMPITGRGELPADKREITAPHNHSQGQPEGAERGEGFAVSYHRLSSLQPDFRPSASIVGLHRSTTKELATVSNSKFARRSQTMEMRTIGGDASRSYQQSTNHDGQSGHSAAQQAHSSNYGPDRRPDVALSNNNQGDNRNEKPAVECSGLVQGEEVGGAPRKKLSNGTLGQAAASDFGQSVAYALQTAATPAIGAAAASQIVVVKSGDNNDQLPEASSSSSFGMAGSGSGVSGGVQSKYSTTNKAGTSSKAAGGSSVGTIVKQQQGRRQQQLDEVGDNFVVAETQRLRGQACGTNEALGTIQASLERVKSIDARRKSMEAQAAIKQRRKSGCFNYHDEYEYSYGLVQSSDSDNDSADLDHYYYDDGDNDDDDGDDEDGDGYTDGAKKRHHDDEIRLRSSTHRPAAQRSGGCNKDAAQMTSIDRAAKVSTTLTTSIAVAGAAAPAPTCDYGPNLDEPNADDGKSGGFATEDDDFEHDGRVSLERTNLNRSQQQQQQSGRFITSTDAGVHPRASQTLSSDERHHQRRATPNRKQGRRRSSGKRRQHVKHDFELDEPRIDSATLITATLSAGGAIVESGRAGLVALPDRATDSASPGRVVVTCDEPVTSTVATGLQTAAGSSLPSQMSAQVIGNIQTGAGSETANKDEAGSGTATYLGSF